MDSKKELGQYFTENKELQDKVYGFILNKPDVILEPCIGRGDLIRNNLYKYDMFEIDKDIGLNDNIERGNVVFCDFLNVFMDKDKKYKTIIGNPPYVKTKKGNLYIDFIEKCFRLLDKGGELIFIIPSDFFKLTSSSKLIDCMMEKGTFTHIYHPHKENLFKGASIDVIVFRYELGNYKRKVCYNEKEMYIEYEKGKGMITFSKKEGSENNFYIEELFDVYVGLVSGKEEVYKNKELGNKTFINGNKYIFIKEYPSGDDKIDEYLLKNKEMLIRRRIRKFNDKNWFEWGAPRNIKKIEENIGKDCLYVYNLTRKENVCFRSKVNYFGGDLLLLLPKKDIDLEIVKEHINSLDFREKFTYSGRFKIGHRQLSKCRLNI